MLSKLFDFLKNRAVMFGHTCADVQPEFLFLPSALPSTSNCENSLNSLLKIMGVSFFCRVLLG